MTFRDCTKLPAGLPTPALFALLLRREKMILRKLLLLTAMPMCFLGVSASAGTLVWDWGNPDGGAITTLPTNVYATDSTTPSGIFLTDRGYYSDGADDQLYWKNSGADEHGIGFANTDDNELTLTADGSNPANFMQVDVSNIYLTFTDGAIRVQSVTGPEKWDLWGTDTLDALSGATELIDGGTADNVFVTLPSWGTYKYYDLTVHPDPSSPSDNVLLDAVEATSSTPEASTMILFAGGAGLVVLWRRRTLARQ